MQQEFGGDLQDLSSDEEEENQNSDQVRWERIVYTSHRPHLLASLALNLRQGRFQTALATGPRWPSNH